MCRTRRGRRGGDFRFETSWLGEEGCAEDVGEAWKDAMAAPQNKMQQALKVVAGGTDGLE